MGDADPTTSATLPMAAGTAEPGGSIGRYRIERMLGAGGMGLVVAAFDPELDRHVAIKVLRELGGGGGGSFGERLRREAQALARITHPNVVAVYDAGVTDSPYLVMQLVEGETLGAYLARGDRNPAEIVALFVQAARGLAAIHAAGLIHRDFKPSNALVDRDGVVRVSDLGLARIGELAHDTREGARLAIATTTHGVAGTPAYMAPEQAAGGEVGPACDQFSLCVALWEALFGARPYPGATLEEIRAGFAKGPPEPPATAVDRSVVRALRRGLAVDPAARFATMDELVTALAPRQRAPRAAIAAAASVVVGGAAIAFAVRGRAPGSAPAPSAGFAIEASTRRLTTTEPCEEYPAFGPDGTIYFDGPVGPDNWIFTLAPSTGERRALSTLRGGWELAPQPSPDGTQLAFLRSVDQKMAAYVGPIDRLEAARRIAGGGFRPAWSPDGRYVWAGSRSGLARYDAQTGAKDRTLTLPAGAYPMLGLDLPDGRFVLLTRSGTAAADGLALYAAGAATSRWLIEGSDEHPMEEVLTLAPDRDAVIVSRLSPTNTPELARVPLAGGPPTPLAGAAGISARKRLAIRGATAVWSDCTERIGLAEMTTDAAGATRFADLAQSPWVDADPHAVPGTNDLVFISYRTTNDEIWRVARDGTNPRHVPFGELEPDRLFLSTDGRMLGAVTADGVFVGPLAGDAPPHRVLPGDSDESNAAFSRDGRTLYVERRDDAMRRIAEVPVTGGAPTWRLPAPSFAPAMAPTDDTLAYLTYDPTAPAGADGVVVMLLDLATGTSRRAAPDLAPYPFRDLRWSADGRRLLAIRRDGESVELDRATGAVLRRFSAGADQLVGATFQGDAIVVGRVTSAGDLWSIALREAE